MSDASLTSQDTASASASEDDGAAGGAASTAGARPRPKRLALPRWLLLGWSVWLLVSWYLAFGRDQALALDSDAHVASVRQMLISIALWLAVAWPLFRLSGRPIRAPRLACFVDFLAVAGTFQVVVWPMRLLTPWHLTTVVLIDLMIIAWAFVMSGVIAWALITTDDLRGRFVWTLVCIALLLGGPLLSMMLATGPLDAGGAAMRPEVLHWSPVSAMWILASRTELFVDPVEWARLIVLAAVGLLLWGGVVCWPRRAIPKPPGTSGGSRTMLSVRKPQPQIEAADDDGPPAGVTAGNAEDKPTKPPRSGDARGASAP
ncbi:MAG: hypothetical protein ACOC0P_00385 [Planctomycetota bacterium]